MVIISQSALCYVSMLIVRLYQLSKMYTHKNQIEQLLESHFHAALFA